MLEESRGSENSIADKDIVYTHVGTPFLCIAVESRLLERPDNLN